MQILNWGNIGLEQDNGCCLAQPFLRPVLLCFSCQGHVRHQLYLKTRHPSSRLLSSALSAFINCSLLNESFWTTAWLSQELPPPFLEVTPGRQWLLAVLVLVLHLSGSPEARSCPQSTHGKGGAEGCLCPMMRKRREQFSGSFLFSLSVCGLEPLSVSLLVWSGVRGACECFRLGPTVCGLHWRRNSGRSVQFAHLIKWGNESVELVQTGNQSHRLNSLMRPT